MNDNFLLVVMGVVLLTLFGVIIFDNPKKIDKDNGE